MNGVHMWGCTCQWCCNKLHSYTTYGIFPKPEISIKPSFAKELKDNEIYILKNEIVGLKEQLLYLDRENDSMKHELCKLKDFIKDKFNIQED
jgi:hypothetical protein